MLKKLVLAAVALVVVAGLGLFFWARSILATDAVRSALATQVSKAIGQPVTVGGVTASVYPRVAVTLTDVGIGGNSQITMKSLEVGTDFGALLSRRIEHGALFLNDARVTLPLPAFTIPASEPSGADANASAAVEIVSIDDIVLKGIEIVSGGRTLRGDIEVVPQGAGLLVRKVELRAADATITATGTITDLTGPVGELAIKAGSLDFDQLLAFANDFSSGAGLPSAGSGAAPEAAPPAAPATASTLDMTISIEAERATMGGLAIEKVTGKAVAKGETMTVEPLGFGLFGGRYEGGLTATLGAAPTFRWTAAVSNIDVAAATAFAGSPNTVSGRLSGKVDLRGRGQDAAAAMKTVQGTLRLDVTDGVVKNLGLVRAVGAATSLSMANLQNAAASAKDADERFSRLGATVAVANGVATTDDLRFDATDLSLLANGTVRLDASALNLKGRVMLSEALSKQMPQAVFQAAQDQGRVVLPATITGSASAPAVKIDAGDAAKRALRNTVTQQATPLLKKGIGGLLRR